MTKLLTYDGSAFDGYEMVKVTPRQELSTKLNAYKDRVRLFQRKIGCNLWQFNLFVAMRMRDKTHDDFWNDLRKFLREKYKKESWRFICFKDLELHGAHVLLTIPTSGLDGKFLTELQDKLADLREVFPDLEFFSTHTTNCDLSIGPYFSFDTLGMWSIRKGHKVYSSPNLKRSIPFDADDLLRDLHLPSNESVTILTKNKTAPLG